MHPDLPLSPTDVSHLPTLLRAGGAFEIPSVWGGTQTLRTVTPPFGYKVEFTEKFIAVLLILPEHSRQPNQFI